MTDVGNKTILVVDDEPQILYAVSQVLTEAGYRVLTAEDGEEALRIMAGCSVDLLLIDIFMPQRDGVETITMLRKRKVHPPIIAMSGGGLGISRGEILDQACQLGAQTSLSKPFSAEQLRAAVSIALGAS